LQKDYNIRVMKKWTLLFITNKGKIRGIPLSEKAVFYTILLLSMFLGAFTYVTIEGTKKKNLLEECKRLELKKQEYLQRLINIKKDVSLIREKLARVGENNEILALTGKLDVINKSIKQMGVGGFPKSEEFYSLELDTSVEGLEKQIDKINNLVELEKQSLQKAGNKLGELDDRLSHIPSSWPTQGHFGGRGFGWHKHPITGRIEFHYGLDISNRPFTPIFATADGTVSFVGWWGGYGNVIVIDHGYGFSTRYAHLAQVYVHKWQEVKRGERIGAMGCTGFATGTHLHYEVRVLGRAVDPMNYLDTFPYTY
jgi:murein DD-endopeptidase MepM/ murein hydrolase activator NlpD